MAKARKKSGDSSPAFTRFRSKVTRYSNIKVGLAHVKFDENLILFRNALPHALRNKVYRQLMWPCEKPVRLNDLWGPGIAAITSLAAELEWAAQVLIAQSDQLTKFVKIRDKCEILYLQSEVDSLIAELDRAEDELGLSLWLIEARINAIQLKSGFKAQRDYTASILSYDKIHPFIGFIISWLSLRAEENLSAQDFEKLVDKSGLKGSYVEGLIKATLGIVRELTAEEAAEAISYTDALTPVDRYTFYIMICQLYLSSGDDKTDEPLAFSLTAVAKNIKDRQLERLILTLGGDRSAEPSPLVPLLDAYVDGDHDESLTHALKLASETSSIEALAMAVRLEALENRKITLSHLKNDCVINKIASDLSEITLAGTNASDAEARLAKLRTTNPRSSWASSLELILKRQRNDERINPASPAQILASLRTTENNPYLAFSLPSRLAFKYLENAFKEKDSRSLTSTISLLTGQSIEPTPNGSINRANRIKAIAHIRQGNYEGAIRTANDVIRENFSPLDRLEAQILLAEALLRNGELESACDVCVSLILSSRYLARRLPLQRLIDALTRWDESAERSLRVLGTLPIVLLIHMYNVLYPSQREELLVDAFIDYLDRSGFEVPSQIDTNVTTNSETLIYFYRFVCVSDALDQCFALRSSRDVEDERAKIIVKCSDVYVEEKRTVPAELQDELQRIRTRQVIRDTSLKLDQSKIHVDVNGIQTFIGNAMKENWNLYRLLGMQKEAAGQFDLINKTLEAQGRKISLLPKTMPATERNSLFRRMFGDIRDQFASSKVFGLDANLSANVRHGYILRELRGPFVNASLVTNLINEDSGYRNNKYWSERLIGDDAYNESLQRILSVFSSSIDAEIERLTRHKVKVRSDSSRDGLFDFSISDFDLQILQRHVDAAETYDEYQDSVFEVLWVMTQIGLNRVKNCLHEETLSAFNSAFTKLQADADETLSTDDAASILQAINLAKPEVSAAVDKVSSWFTLSKAQEYQDYPIQIAFDVGVATVISYFSNLEISASLSGGDNLIMAGWTLPSISRLFLLLMENAALHAGFSEGRLTIRVAVDATQDVVELTVTNALADLSVIDELKATVDRLNRDFGGEAAQDAVGIERGSGYPKLWKILRHDLRRTYDIEVTLTSSGEYRVLIIFNKEGVVR